MSLAAAVRGLPSNWPQLFAAVCAHYAWTPAVLGELTIEEVVWWWKAAQPSKG